MTSKIEKTGHSASEIVERAIKELFNARTHSDAVCRLIHELTVYHNAQIIVDNQSSISTIFDMFRLKHYQTYELAHLLVLFVISGYRVHHQAVIDEFKAISVNIYAATQLRFYCIYGLAVFRLFTDMGVKERRKIKPFLDDLRNVENFNGINIYSHNAYMATLSYQEYLKSINVTEAKVKDAEKSHQDHLQPLTDILEYFLYTDGFEEHELSNQGIRDVINYLKNEAANMEDDGFTLIEKDENDQIELNEDNDGFVHL